MEVLITPVILLLVGVAVINMMIPETKKLFSVSKIMSWAFRQAGCLIRWLLTLPFRIIGWVWSSVFGGDNSDDDDNNGGGDVHYHGGTHHHHH